MSRESYLLSQEVSAMPFDAIIMGFMRIADDDNLAFLKCKYPMLWKELQARYNAPGGYLEPEAEMRLIVNPFPWAVPEE
ncbi:MAG: hypothetical protein KKD44_29220 [Proteobacteria bacterium]|nr:hypothetical protein [Pseudomonadota bacterium]